MPPSKPTDKPITVKLDGHVGQALRQYKNATKLPISQIVYRAILCYWVGQNTPEAAHAISVAEFYGDESYADAEEYTPETEAKQ